MRNNYSRAYQEYRNKLAQLQDVTNAANAMKQAASNGVNAMNNTGVSADITASMIDGTGIAQQIKTATEEAISAAVKANEAAATARVKEMEKESEVSAAKRAAKAAAEKIANASQTVSTKKSNEAKEETKAETKKETKLAPDTTKTVSKELEVMAKQNPVADKYLKKAMANAETESGKIEVAKKQFDTSAKTTGTKTISNMADAQKQIAQGVQNKTGSSASNSGLSLVKSIQTTNTAYSKKKAESAKAKKEEQKKEYNAIQTDLRKWSLENEDNYNAYREAKDAFDNGNIDAFLRSSKYSLEQRNKALVYVNSMNDAQSKKNERSNEWQELQATIIGGLSTTGKAALASLYDNRLSGTDGNKNSIDAIKKEGYDESDINDMVLYLDFMSNAINAQYATQSAIADVNSSAMGATGASLGSVPLSVGSGVTGTGSLIGQNLNRMISGSDAPIDTNSPGLMPNNISKAIRGATAENIEGYDYSKMLGDGYSDLDKQQFNNNIGKLLSFGYQTGLSGLDSALAASTGFGGSLLGSSAGVSSYVDAKEKGATDQDALMYGVVAGTFENLFENWSIGNFKKLQEQTITRGMRDALLNIGKSTVTNFEEETATQIADDLAEYLLLKEKSGLSEAYQNAYQQAIQSGMSEEEAKKHANGEAAKWFAEDAIVAGLGGALMGAGFGAIGNISSARNGKAVNQFESTLSDEQKTAYNNLSDEEKINTAKFYNYLNSFNDAKVDKTDNIQQETAENNADADKNWVNLSTLATNEAVAQIKQNIENGVENTNKYVKEFYYAKGSQFTDMVERKAENREALAQALGMDVNELPGTDAGIRQFIQNLKAEDFAANNVANTTETNQNYVEDTTDTGLNNVTEQTATADNSALTQRFSDEAVNAVGNYADAENADYLRAFSKVYLAAKRGQSETTALNGAKAWSNQLTVNADENLKEAYRIGAKEYAQARAKNDANYFAVNAQMQKNGAKAKGAGVDVDSKRGVNKKTVRMLERVAKKTGLHITVTDKLAQNENGALSLAYGEIILNANGGNIYQSLIHELKEHIESWNGEDAALLDRALIDFAASTMGAERVDQLNQRYQNAYQNENGGDYSESATELNNDFLSGIASTEEGAQQFVEWLMDSGDYSATEKKTILERIADMIKQIIDSMKRFATTAAKEGKMAAENDIERATAIMNQFLSALDTANAQMKQANGVVAENQLSSDNGEKMIVNGAGEAVAYQNDGSIVFSKATYEEEGRQALNDYLNRMSKRGLISKAEAKEISGFLDYVNQQTSKIIDEHSELTDFSKWSKAKVAVGEDGNPVFRVVVSNEEYPMDIDFSQICTKRETLDKVLTYMVQNSMLDIEKMDTKSISRINSIIKKYGFDIACTMCYVEGKRHRSPVWANGIASEYNRLLEKAEIKNGVVTNKGALYEEVEKIGKENGNKGTFTKNFADAIVKNPSISKKLDAEQLLTSKGIAELKQENPALYSAVIQRQGQATPKSTTPYTQYQNELLKNISEKSLYKTQASEWSTDEAFRVGGVRMHSFSDFVPKMFFDYCQLVADMNAKKLPAHTYTKVESFVKLFGKTGIKINMSGVPKISVGGKVDTSEIAKEWAGFVCDKNGKPVLDENGNYTYAWADESFDFDTAMEIQSDEEYSKNCGFNAIGVSDNHILALMADSRVKMIIPYHKSGVNAEVAAINGISAFTSYETSQEEYKQKAEKLKNESWYEYYNRIARNKNLIGNKAASNNFDFYGTCTEEETPVTASKKYVEHCQKNGVIPKFAKFAYNSDGSFNKNYYKLLTDFSMFDANGEYAQQEIVRFGKDYMPDNWQEILVDALSEKQVKDDALDKKIPSIADEIKNALDGKSVSDKYAGLSMSKAVSDDYRVPNWVKNDTSMTDGELVELYSKIADVQKRNYSAVKDENGNTLIETKYHIVYTDDSFSRPEIRAVIEFDTKPFNIQNAKEAFVSIIAKGGTYEESVKVVEGLYGDGLVSRKDAGIYRTDARQVGGRTGTDGRRNLEGTGKDGLEAVQNREITTQKDLAKEIRSLPKDEQEVAENLRERLAYRKNIASVTDKRFEKIYDDYSYGKNDTKAYLAYINPYDFIDLTTTDTNSFYENNRNGLNEGVSEDWGTENNIQNSGVLYLKVDGNGKVIGHEGRHRMLGLDRAGYQDVAVVIEVPKVSDAKPVMTMRLTGQDYDDRRNYSNATLHRLMPVTERYKSINKALYADLNAIRGLTRSILGDNDLRYSKAVTDDTEKYIEKSTKRYGNVENAAVKHFGITKDFRVAGYVLRDGKMLDFSGAHWLEGSSPAYIEEWRKKNDIRQVDHEDIFEAFEISSDDFPSDSRKEFINRGNIRVAPEAPGINIASEPTIKQYDVIRELIRRNPYMTEGFYVDIENKKGRINKLVYSGNVNQEKVINDIKRFYETGEIAEQSPLAQFRYSIGVKDNISKTNRELASENTKLRQQVETLKKEFKLSEGHNVDAQSVKALVTRIKGIHKVTMERAEMETKLTNLFNYIANADELNWNDVMDAATDLAKDFLMTSRKTETRLREQYDNYQKLWDDTKEIKLNQHDYDGVKAAYDNPMFGKILGIKVRVDNNARSLDTVGLELAELYPEWFTGEEVAEDIFGRIAEVRQAINEVQYDDELDIDSAAQYLAQDLFDAYMDTPEHSTVADKHKKEVDDLKRKYKQQKNDALEKQKERYEAKLAQITEYNKTLEENNEEYRISRLARIGDLMQMRSEMISVEKERNQLLHDVSDANSEVKNLNKEMTQKNRRIRTLENQRDNAKVKARAKLGEKLFMQQAKYQGMIQNNRTNRKKTELRHKIIALNNDLAKRITNPSGNSYVPKNLMKATAEMAGIVSDILGVNDMVMTGKSTQYKEKLLNLRSAYALMASDSDYALASEYNEELAKSLDELITISTKSVSELNLSELEGLYNIMRTIQHTVRNAVKLINSEFTSDVYETGEALMDETKNNAKGYNLRKPFGRLDAAYRTATVSPQWFFRRLGGYSNGSWEQVGKMLDEGQKEVLRLKLEGNEIFSELQDKKWKKNLNAFNKTTVAFKDTHGQKHNISPAMRCSLYMHSLNAENMRHIMKGGITVPDTYLYNKGDFENAYKQGETVHISTNEMQELFDGMSEYEKEWCKKAYKFFNEWTKGVINKTSMDLVGFKKAIVENYFSIRTDKNFTQQNMDSLVNSASIENIGSLQKRKNGTNPILLEDITNVITRQLNNTALYGGMAIPVRNFKKIWNVQTPNIQGEVHSVKEYVGNKFGADGQKYITNLVDDLQLGRSREDNNFMDILDTLRGNYAGAVLGLNPRVALGQTASLPTAAYVLGYSPIAKAMPEFIGNVNSSMVNGKRIQEWLDKSAKVYDNPLLKYRNIGNSTQELSDIQGKWQSKIPGSKWIQKMDTATVATLLRASEIWVDDNTKLKKGTKEHNKAVSDKFTEVVEYTQPNSTVMQKTDWARSTNSFVRMMSMFRTQRDQNANILIGAWENYRANAQRGEASKKKAAKEFRRAVSSQITQAVVYSAMYLAIGALFYGRWKDIDDENGDVTAGSVASAILEKTASTVFGSFLFGSSLYNLANAAEKVMVEGESTYTATQYLEPDVPGLSTVYDLYEKSLKLAETSRDFVTGDASYNDVLTSSRKLVEVGANMLGVPFANAMKLYEGISGNIKALADGNFAQGSTTAKAQYKRLFDAMESGNEEEAKKAVEKLTSIGKDDSAILSGIKENAYQSAGAKKMVDSAIGSVYGELSEKDKSSVKSSVNEVVRTASLLDTTNITQKSLDKYAEMDDKQKSKFESNLSYTDILVYRSYDKLSKTNQEMYKKYRNNLSELADASAKYYAANKLAEDTNGNGKIDEREYKAYLKKSGYSSLMQQYLVKLKFKS